MNNDRSLFYLLKQSILLPFIIMFRFLFRFFTNLAFGAALRWVLVITAVLLTMFLPLVLMIIFFIWLGAPFLGVLALVGGFFWAMYVAKELAEPKSSLRKELDEYLND